MSELSPETTKLIVAARVGDEPATGDHARVRAALVAKLAIGTAIGASTRTAAAATARTGVGVKLGIAVALVAVAGGGVWLATRGSVTPRSDAAVATPVMTAPAPATAVEPPAPAPAPELAPAPPSILPAHRQPAHRSLAPAAPVATAEAADVRLERETAALRAVREALRDSNPDRALARLDDYRHQFPSGILTEEAEALRIDALCARGNVDDARTAATRFVTAHPRSIHAARVARGCEGVPP